MSAALLAMVLAAQSPAIVAHRGLAEGMPENTLVALRRSIDRGLEVIELDVRTTGDGHLVILHDETLDRTTDCTGRLSDVSLDRIRHCDAGGPSHAGEKIPTLAEVLDLTRGRPVRLLLDIKQGTSVRAVLKSVRAHRAETRVIVGLRQVADVIHVRTAAPALTVIAFLPNFRDARLFANAGASIVRLWSDWAEAEPAIVERTKALGPKVWIMVGRKLPKRDDGWRALHARMISKGADGLITDRPELISAP